MVNHKISLSISNSLARVGFGYHTEKGMAIFDWETLQELKEVVEQLETEKKALKGAIFFTHHQRSFLAGVDLDIISAFKTEAEGVEGAEFGQFLFNRIEDLPFPTVACVHGVCLGGGMELALACSEILVSDDPGTQMGLPEVKLGILPAFGGTWRLPRRIGQVEALEIILTGKNISPRKARKMGLAAEVYPKERLVAMAEERIRKKGRWGKNTPSPGRRSSFLKDNFLSRKVVFQKAREKILKKTQGFYQAPLKILDVMEGGMMKGRSSYLSSEAQAFGELCIGEQSKNLQHIFYMTEKAKKKHRGEAEDILPLKRGICLGAGTMGGGITWLMAVNEMFPVMKDLNKKALEVGLEQVHANFKEALKRKKMTGGEIERKMRTISPRQKGSFWPKGDLLIEAIVEDMALKSQVLAQVEKGLRKEAIITSNTSSLSIEKMGQGLEHPHRFAGLHFFNPVHRMPLVEIITHSAVSQETVMALYAWVLKVKKIPIVVKDGPGFLVNRILMPYLNEAGHLLAEGVSVRDLDEACLNFGMPMGPCRLLDEVGIDVAAKVSDILHQGLGERARPGDIPTEMVKRGLLGKKSGEGFYLYNNGKKGPEINKEMRALLPRKASSMDETEIQMRLFLPMINEASFILQEKLVDGPSTIDLGLIFGIGFPPFRGGLLRYADSERLPKIVEALERFSREVNVERYQVGDYLRGLVERQEDFYSVEAF